MKRIIGIVVIFLIGFISSIMLMRLLYIKPFVYFTFKNESSKNIQYVKVIDENNDYIQLVENIANNESRNMRFYMSGEGSIRIAVKLEDETIIKDTIGYVENGYGVNAIIKSDRIETDIDVRADSTY